MTRWHLAQRNVGRLRADASRDSSDASGHVDFLRRRLEWFTPRDGTRLVLSWIPAGHEPTIEEAEERLRRLTTDGPGNDAFTFARTFPPPDVVPR